MLHTQFSSIDVSPDEVGSAERALDLRMSQALSATLKKTPLNVRHCSLGARMVEYGGWLGRSMPDDEARRECAGGGLLCLPALAGAPARKA